MSIGSITSTGSVTVDETLPFDGGDDFDAWGDIYIGGGVADQGTIHIAGTLVGDITIDGDLNGHLLIDESTVASYAFIHLGGLGSSGLVSINHAQGGAWDAGGDIEIGDPKAVFPPGEPPPVTYDGCIQILDDGGNPPNGGDLDGNVDVYGCHNVGDLAMSVSGSILGTRTIYQADCTNQVDWTTCP
ncbi:MAG: hypothetical protein V3W34_12645 [Phycisphaerae bacterium]